MSKEVSLFDGNKLPSYLQTREIDEVTTVSYTHLTLPTKRIV